MDSIGQYVFGPNGIDLGQGQQGRIGYAPDCAGGIFVSWLKTGYRLQRISVDGTISFVQNGLILALDSTTIGSRGIVPDLTNGVVGLWTDNRNAPENSFYAQRIDSAGELLWDSTGVEFHSTSQNPFFAASARPYYSDGRGGALYVWVQQAPGFGARVMLKQISLNGNLGEVVTTVNSRKNDSIYPKNIELISNYPNPFNNSTAITVKANKTIDITLKIHNVLGEEIRTLFNGKISSGTHKIIWDGRNNWGREVSSGIYFYQLIYRKSIYQTKKMLLVR